MEVMSSEDESETPLEGSVIVASGALQRVSSSERKRWDNDPKHFAFFMS